MKTLFLTSAGIKVHEIKKEFLKILPKPPKELTITHIITASKVIDDVEFVKNDRAVMDKLGFKVNDYDLTGKNHEEIKADLANTDILYLQGGNGFYLLKQIKETNFEEIVKDLISKGVLYVGVSAGTYVACPTIEMHKWKRELDNMYGLGDLQAMNLIPYLISVHYNREKYRELLINNIPTASYPVKILTDSQAFLVKDGQTKLVGEGEEVLI